ncbi:hypothetical protein F5B21DRAFT_468848 [Xylaria acuta]|nr:hypothetical protein F5B21DRAFT_468848 [Xylaria acuta]
MNVLQCEAFRGRPLNASLLSRRLQFSKTHSVHDKRLKKNPRRTAMDQDYIDSLLERYLHLLHEYISLREELTTLQTGMYQNIARANFAAERGLRFGRDFYDDRMQASRRLDISCENQDQQSESRDRRGPTVPGGASILSFTVINPAAARVSSLIAEDSKASVEAPDPRPHPEAEVEAEAESVEQSATQTTNTEDGGASTPSSQASIEPQPGEDAGTAASGSPSDSPPTAKKGRTTPQQKSNDPLRWFGLLTPVPLRQAQAQSIRVVEHVIPRLASVNAEMAEVEIEVRRARKRRAKAVAAVIRLSQQSGQELETGAGTEGGVTSDVCA